MKDLSKIGFRGSIKDGKFVPVMLDMWLEHIKELEGKKVVAKVSDKVEVRTLRQNRFYWAYLRLISHATGENAKALHHEFKGRYLPPEIYIYQGVAKEAEPSTTNLTKKAFNAYILEIEAESQVPPPPTIIYGLDELDYGYFEEKSKSS